MENIDTKDIKLVYNPIITSDDSGNIFVQGEPLDNERLTHFRAALRNHEDNYARTVIRDQLKWLAINQGIHQCQTDSQLIFAKAALWLIDQEERLIQMYKN